MHFSSFRLGTGMEDPVFGPKGVRLLLVFRGASGFVGLSGLYFSLQYLSLSDATVLTFLSPLCTAVAGALFLHESFRLTQALAGIVSLIGVTLIARPPFIFGNGEMSKGTAAERVIAVGVSLIGVLGMTSAYTTIRAIGKRAHSMHSVAYFAMISVTLSVIGMIVTGTPFIIPSRLDELGLLLAIGVSSFAALHLLTMGLQREAAGRASMAVYTQIVFATIYQRVFFHMYPSWLSIIGTCLILSSALYVAMTKEKAVLENIEHGSIHLTHDDHDHLEAGLHGAHAKSSDSSSRQEQM
ncbi:hypothetical protein AX15_007383 [Amanita polypyramis BW_CC]|nr:hypothetical protein AX15_007383 [Amanita polypyramis BW_CC]